MKNLITIVAFSVAVTIFGGCSFLNQPEKERSEDSIWYPNGRRQSIQSRLGIAGQEQLPLEVLLRHAENLGYSIEEHPLEANYGVRVYGIDTQLNKNKSSWLIYNVEVKEDGTIDSIVELALPPSQVRLFTNFIGNLTSECQLCDNVESESSIAKSKFANTGPVNVEFPERREKSIRFKLGLADSYSIHSEAVFFHARALGYEVTDFGSFQLDGRSQLATASIETGLSLSGKHNQSFELHIDENGWIVSIIEKRRKLSSSLKDE